MIYISFQKPMLFFRGWVLGVIKGVGGCWGVVIVAPLGEVISEFEARDIGGGVFEIDND